MKNRPLVLKEVVDSDLCIGCGACVDACPSNALDMKWDEKGLLIASNNLNECDNDGACLAVCPFNPDPPSRLRTEDEISQIFLDSASLSHLKIGRYVGIYAGYSKKFRQTSSSGGIATYVFEQLLLKGIVDHIITVSDSETELNHYDYQIISDPKNILRTSGTRYYPVSMDNVLGRIRGLRGKVAISGVACFIKALRLAQENDPIFKEKIVFLSGIICGGVKSKYFTDYLGSKVEVNVSAIREPNYRVKDHYSTANDYAFSCMDDASKKWKSIKMKSVGDMWGTGLFKANACDFCDDVTTELADISLGDAWIDPYRKDGSGHNVIVTRSSLADELIRQGSESNELEIEPLPREYFLKSQQGSFNHRHDGLNTRGRLRSNRGYKVPPKRHGKVKQPFHLVLVQRLRQSVRSRSLRIWRETLDAKEFDKRMSKYLLMLKAATKFSNLIKNYKRGKS